MRLRIVWRLTVNRPILFFDEWAADQDPVDLAGHELGWLLEAVSAGRVLATVEPS